jgi:hypothetical protein
MDRNYLKGRRSATGSSSKRVTARKAALLFAGAEPGATLAFSASTPSCAKSLRHRRRFRQRKAGGPWFSLMDG